MMHLRRALAICATLLVFAAGLPFPATHAQGEEVPRWEATDCADFPINVGVTCGYLVVPEDRAQPDGATVRLPVAIFRATGQNPAPDPIIYLQGGPGGHLLVQSPGIIEMLRLLLRERDMILFDQRGTGFAQPALDCPEMDADYFDSLVLSLDGAARSARQVEAAAQCRDRLDGEGVNLSAYTSAEDAADVADLRAVLGYEQVNLLGISYGTRLALTVMRDHPEGIRSVILDSVYPPQVSLLELVPANGQRAFDVFFAGCAADALCRQNHPDLQATFYDLVDRLNAEPITLPVVEPISRRSYDVILNGDLLVEAIFQLLYRTDLLPLLPRAIGNTAAGDTRVLSLLASQLVAQPLFMSEGMFYSVQCTEEAPFSTAESMTAATESVEPRLRRALLSAAETFTICATWGVEAAGALENEPVTSDIPTLLLAGEYDPITPPAWAQQAAESLPNSRLYQFAGTGHGVIFSRACALNVARAFLNDPAAEPNAACVDRLDGPDFE